MVKQSSIEQRQWVRAKRILSVQHRLANLQKKALDSEWRLSTTYDMSLGGLAFFSDIEYRQGDIIDIHVVMSGILDIFRGFGKVVRVERKKTGAYFLVAVKFLETPKKRNAKTYKPRIKTQLRGLKRI